MRLLPFLSAFVLLGCNQNYRANESPTGPVLPGEDLDASLLHYSAIVPISGTDRIWVVGVQGLLVGDGDVTLFNTQYADEDDFAYGDIILGPDGDFVATIDVTLGDALSLTEEVPNTVLRMARLPIDAPMASAPNTGVTQTGPLFPAPTGSATHMDVRQFDLTPPFVVFNTDSGAAVEVLDDSLPIELDAAVGDEACVFPITEPTAATCYLVTDVPAAP